MMYARGQYNIRSLGEVVKIAPVTLPALRLDDIDVEAEAREAQARVAERRVIRRGLDAWAAVGAARSFESWKTIGAALSVGKRHALRVTGADRAWGRNYSREFGEWMKRHGFATMPKSTRSVAIELAENIKAVEQWRSTLPEKQRKRLVHPLSNVARWKASLTHGNGKSPTDLRRDAKAAWARFCACARALPAAESVPLWQTAQRQASEALCR